jgi:hypothetical protein
MAAVAATNLLAEQLAATESAVAQAISHKDLTRAISMQACVVAKEATWCHVNMLESLPAACCIRTAAIDPANIASANKTVVVAEVTTNEMDQQQRPRTSLRMACTPWPELRVAIMRPLSAPPIPSANAWKVAQWRMGFLLGPNGQ